jgi:hypothetical protein
MEVTAGGASGRVTALLSKTPEAIDKYPICSQNARPYYRVSVLFSYVAQLVRAQHS